MASCLSAASAHTWMGLAPSARVTSTSTRHDGLPLCTGLRGQVGSRSQSFTSSTWFGNHSPMEGSITRVARRTSKGLVVRAEVSEKRSGQGGRFFTGFLIGGVVLGVLGFFFAPQISKTLLGENEDGTPRRLPRWLDEEDSLEATRRSLNEKIAQLNAAIDDVSAQLRADETADEELETSL